MTTTRALLIGALAAVAIVAPRPVGPCSSDADCARRFPDRVRFDNTGRPFPYVPAGVEAGTP